MADFDDFSFDDFDDSDNTKSIFDEEEDIFGDSGKKEDQDSSTSDFGSFGEENDSKKVQTVDSAKNSSGNLIKQSIIMAATGIGIVVLVFCIASGIKSGRNNEKITHTESSKENQSQSNNENVNNNNANSSKDWILLSGENNISFEEKLVESQFTVTDINHYIKVISSENFEIKTVLSGSISGMAGTYDLEVPYSKGRLLSVGNKFNVKVQVGTYKENVVIGEIEY